MVLRGGVAQLIPKFFKMNCFKNFDLKSGVKTGLVSW